MRSLCVVGVGMGKVRGKVDVKDSIEGVFVATEGIVARFAVYACSVEVVNGKANCGKCFLYRPDRS